MKKIILFCLIFLLISSPLFAADYYIRSGESGDGSSWSSPAGNLPTSLVRGTNYWMAEGAYGSLTFNSTKVPASNATYIYIRRAVSSTICTSLGLTASECHGPSSGWNDTWGDDIATIDPIVVSTNPGWVEMDGMYGSGEGTEYGFYMDFDAGGTGINVTGSSPNMHFKYFEILCETDGFINWTTAEQTCIRATYSSMTGHVYSYIECHGVDTGVYCEPGNCNGAIFENNIFHHINGNATAHQNLIFFSAGNADVTIRNNIFYNWNVLGIFATWWADSSGPVTMGPFYIYGNLFYDGTNSAFYLRHFGDGGDPPFTGPFYFYNNTCIGINCIYNQCEQDGAAACGTGNVSRNNIGSGTTISGSDPINSNNYDYNTNWFVDYNGNDYHLVSDGAAGTGYTLSSPYNTDMDGVTRGNGTWDVGAYEYDAGGAPSIIKKIMTFFRRLRG